MTSPRCTFSWPGTYGHECGKPAELAGQQPSRLTVSGIYWSLRCPECAQVKGGENARVQQWLSFNPSLHINRFN